MANIRIFIAVDISEEQRSQAQRLADRLGGNGDGYRWTEPLNYHLTLHFLGEILETEITDVCRRIKRVAEGFSGFEMSVEGAGAFPAVDRPRTIWAGVERGREQICELQAAVSETMEDMGFPGENRKYQPHLTLGRIKRAGRFDPSMQQSLEKHANFDCGVTFVDEVVVYSSFLDRSGPSYTAVSRSKLGPGA